jgi:hypothetical protein
MNSISSLAPHCGGKAVIMEGTDYLNIFCEDCGSNWYPLVSGLDALSEEATKETALLWNVRATPGIRRWEAGSEPPEGIYLIYNKKHPRHYAIHVTPKEPYSRLWKDMSESAFLWGPIPEPKEV